MKWFHKLMKARFHIVILLLSGLSLLTCSHNIDHSKINNHPDARYAWKVNWHSLEKGIIISRAEGKPMIVDFAVHKGCHRCQFMQDNLYSNDIIVDKINSDFVPVFIDLATRLTPAERALGEKHDYHEDCMLLFLTHEQALVLDEDGSKMCFVDKIETHIMMRYLDHVINVHNQKKSR